MLAGLDAGLTRWLCDAGLGPGFGFWDFFASLVVIMLVANYEPPRRASSTHVFVAENDAQGERDPDDATVYSTT